jgi:hypothetical protein
MDRNEHEYTVGAIMAIVDKSKADPKTLEAIEKVCENQFLTPKEVGFQNAIAFVEARQETGDILTFDNTYAQLTSQGFTPVFVVTIDPRHLAEEIGLRSVVGVNKTYLDSISDIAGEVANYHIVKWGIASRARREIKRKQGEQILPEGVVLADVESEVSQRIMREQIHRSCLSMASRAFVAYVQGIRIKYLILFAELMDGNGFHTVGNVGRYQQEEDPSSVDAVLADMRIALACTDEGEDLWRQAERLAIRRLTRYIPFPKPGVTTNLIMRGIIASLAEDVKSMVEPLYARQCIEELAGEIEEKGELFSPDIERHIYSTTSEAQRNELKGRCRRPLILTES